MTTEGDVPMEGGEATGDRCTALRRWFCFSGDVFLLALLSSKLYAHAFFGGFLAQITRDTTGG